MPQSAPMAINPELFRWARETAGQSVEDAAEGLGMSNAARLASIEAGDRQPSRPMLLKMAKQYRRSLLSFYLATPPRRGDRGQDFRTLPVDQPVAEEATLDALIRDLKARQALVHELLEDDDDAEPISFIGSIDARVGVDGLTDVIRGTLRFHLAEFRRQDNYEEAFKYLRGLTEARGVFVLLVGDLGSYHSAISVETFRGFAIADGYAPFIVINSNDAPAAWSFTLIHELVHLWLGQTGISGGSSEQDVEQFCNDVASEMLLPREELRSLQINNGTPTEESVEEIRKFAGTRRVSRAMVAYKLLRLRKITAPVWRKLNERIRDMWLADRRKTKERQSQSESGPSYYVIRRHRLGTALIGLVHRSMDAGLLSPVKAAKVLGVKPRAVYPLLIDVPHNRSGTASPSR